MTTGIGKEPAPTPEAPRPPVQAGLEPEVIREAKSRQWEKICQLAVCQLDRFMSFEPKVLRGDDPEAIHDMRVASRRLQQIVDVLHPRPQPREIRRLRRKMRRSRGALSDLRNCDVQLARVERLLSQKRASRREAWEAVKSYLIVRRSESFNTASRKLARLHLSVLYVSLKNQLTRKQTAPGDDVDEGDSGPPGLPAADSVYENIRQNLQRRWEDFEASIAESLRDVRAPAVHEARIAAKRLRYLMEVVHELNGAGAGTLAWIRKLQRQLGEWHDLEVQEQMMLEMVGRPQFLRDHLEVALEVEKLLLRQRSRKKAYLEKYSLMTPESDEFRRAKEWVNSLLCSPSDLFATQ